MALISCWSVQDLYKLRTQLNHHDRPDIDRPFASSDVAAGHQHRPLALEALQLHTFVYILYESPVGGIGGMLPALMPKPWEADF